MSRQLQIVIWLAALAGFVVLLGLFQGILLPFVAGLLIAYLLDPVADRLERLGLSRTVAVSLILLGFFLLGAAIVLVLLPPLHSQAVSLVPVLVDLFERARSGLEPLVREYFSGLSAEDVSALKDVAGEYASRVAQWIGQLAKGIWSGGQILFSVLSLLIITPLVAFYMLVEWDGIVAKVDGLLPRDFAATIRHLLAEMDRTMAGFLRGQASVCLVLGVIYAVGLSILGLNFGLLIGLFAGLISFIPYVGSTVGLVVAGAVALTQYSEWLPIVLVAAVFIGGQLIEGYFLTPKLVGGSIGLHPVWILFALMAGGSLMGFTGVLIAVPVAAVIGVLVRYWIDRYRKSGLYLGSGGGGEA